MMQHWGKWVLLVLALLAMPFCWSFGRSIVTILTNEFGLHSDVEVHFAERLLNAQTWQTARDHRERQPFFLSPIYEDACFEFSEAALRPNRAWQGLIIDPIQLRERLGIWPQREVDDYVSRLVRLDIAKRNFTPYASAALIACIEASPFDRYCANYRDERMRNATGTRQEFLVRHGLRRTVVDPTGLRRPQLCGTIPEMLLNR
jgi:hypothetical protein